MMRRTILVLAALSGVALTTACAGQPQQVSGEAKPVGAVVPTTSAVPSATTPAASGSPSTTPTSPTTVKTSPSTAKTSSTPKSAALVFGPTGIGKLKVGMSVRNAEATGELASPYLGDGCGSSKIKAANSADVQIIHSSDKGLLYIPAWGRVATPEGIRIGSSYEKVKATYPDLQFRIAEDNFVFKGDADAGAGWKDGHANVHYRFRFDDYRVAEMALEHDAQNCYE